MNICSWIGIVGVVSALGASTQTRPQRPPTEVARVSFTGNLGGNLSPCGCTKPMSGGIRRRGSALSESILIDSGDWITGAGRQDVLKAQTLAQVASESRGVIALGASEAALGKGEVAQLHRLSGGQMVCGPVEGLLPPTRSVGPFVVSSWNSQARLMAAQLGGTARTEAETISLLQSEAGRVRKAAMLITDLDLSGARLVASRHPWLSAIVYREGGTPSLRAQRVGNVLLLSPGGKGRYLTQIDRVGNGWRNYQVRELTPDFADHPATTQLYQRYLVRVSQEQLLEKLTRQPGEAYAGSQSCQSCHAGEYAVWSKSRHATALQTLEDDGHARDPECVSCHVVGLDVRTGFRSRSETPELANVGCESCHGPLKEHSLRPTIAKPPKATLSLCLTCHTGETSPKFEASTYWGKIAHGKKPRNLHK